MNDALNRRIHNYLERLVVYFDRPQIFDAPSMSKEACNLISDLNFDRNNDTCEDDFVWPPSKYEVPE